MTLCYPDIWMSAYFLQAFSEDIKTLYYFTHHTGFNACLRRRIDTVLHMAMQPAGSGEDGLNTMKHYFF